MRDFVAEGVLDMESVLLCTAIEGDTDGVRWLRERDSETDSAAVSDSEIVKVRTPPVMLEEGLFVAENVATVELTSVLGLIVIDDEKVRDSDSDEEGDGGRVAVSVTNDVIVTVLEKFALREGDDRGL